MSNATTTEVKKPTEPSIIRQPTPPKIEFTGEIYCWEFHRNEYGGYLTGYIVNDQAGRFTDGTPITTSQITKMVFEPRSKEMYVETYNSRYKLIDAPATLDRKTDTKGIVV
jgi:hypothetical protein